MHPVALYQLLEAFLRRPRVLIWTRLELALHYDRWGLYIFTWCLSVIIWMKKMLCPYLHRASVSEHRKWRWFGFLILWLGAFSLNLIRVLCFWLGEKWFSGVCWCGGRKKKKKFGKLSWFIGLGMIGGSFAKALKERGFGQHFNGVDRREGELTLGCFYSGVIDHPGEFFCPAEFLCPKMDYHYSWPRQWERWSRFYLK